MFRIAILYIACSVILWLWHNVDAATFHTGRQAFVTFDSSGTILYEFSKLVKLHVGCPLQYSMTCHHPVQDIFPK